MLHAVPWGCESLLGAPQHRKDLKQGAAYLEPTPGNEKPDFQTHLLRRNKAPKSGASYFKFFVRRWNQLFSRTFTAVFEWMKTQTSSVLAFRTSGLVTSAIVDKVHHHRLAARSRKTGPGLRRVGLCDHAKASETRRHQLPFSRQDDY